MLFTDKLLTAIKVLSVPVPPPTPNKDIITFFFPSFAFQEWGIC